MRRAQEHQMRYCTMQIRVCSLKSGAELPECNPLPLEDSAAWVQKILHKQSQQKHSLLLRPRLAQA